MRRNLTPKQERFCLKYVELGNASEAYRQVYNCSQWKIESIHRVAHKLLYNVKVVSRIDQLQAEEKKRLQKKYRIDQDRLMQEYMRLAFADIRKCFDDNGNIKLPKDIDDDTAAALAAVEVVSSSPSGGDPEYTHKFKLIDKKGPLQDLAKMLGLFLEDNLQKKPETDVQVNNTYELPEALLRGYPGGDPEDG